MSFLKFATGPVYQPQMLDRGRRARHAAAAEPAVGPDRPGRPGQVPVHGRSSASRPQGQLQWPGVPYPDIDKVFQLGLTNMLKGTWTPAAGARRDRQGHQGPHHEVAVVLGSRRLQLRSGRAPAVGPAPVRMSCARAEPSTCASACCCRRATSTSSTAGPPTSRLGARPRDRARGRAARLRLRLARRARARQVERRRDRLRLRDPGDGDRGGGAPRRDRVHRHQLDVPQPGDDRQGGRHDRRDLRRPADPGPRRRLQAQRGDGVRPAVPGPPGAHGDPRGALRDHQPA